LELRKRQRNCRPPHQHLLIAGEETIGRLRTRGSTFSRRGGTFDQNSKGDSSLVLRKFMDTKQKRGEVRPKGRVSWIEHETMSPTSNRQPCRLEARRGKTGKEKTPWDNSRGILRVGDQVRVVPCVECVQPLLGEKTRKFANAAKETHALSKPGGTAKRQILTDVILKQDPVAHTTSERGGAYGVSS